MRSEEVWGYGTPLMTVVGLLAALGPTRQGLSIPPTEALRQD